MDKSAKHILIWGGVGCLALYFVLRKKAPLPPSSTETTPIDLSTYQAGDFNGVGGIDPSSGF